MTGVQTCALPILANDVVVARLVHDRLPRARYHRPSASYLGWIDLGAYRLGADPATVLIDSARVALNSGHSYGAAYDGFVRLNFACDPILLLTAFDRIAAFIERRE